MKTYLRDHQPWLFNTLRLARQTGRRLSSSWRSPKAIFIGIYERNYWGDSYSRSGTGSNLEQTRVLREELACLIHRWKIASILDVPCGDYFWMSHLKIDLPLYIGMDIVPKLIHENKRRYAAANRRFIEGDALTDALPKVDLIFCRDLLVHYCFKEIHKFIEAFTRSQATYLLTTNFPGLQKNTDVLTGDWRPLNLQLAPFHFPPPLDSFNEGCTEQGGDYGDKSLSLWKLSTLARPDA
jgi:hypothetical protein